MARPFKDGVDYWPFDVDLLRDKKFKLIKAEYGVKGAYIAIELMNAIYESNGYYKKWDEDDCLLMSEGVGDGCSSQLISEVVQGCLRRSLLNKRVFEMFGVLTSHGIQKRFLRIVGNSREVIPIFQDYWLLDPEEVPPGTLKKIAFKSVSSQENQDISQDNTPNDTGNAQRKEEERKGKERREKDEERRRQSLDPGLGRVMDYFLTKVNTDPSPLCLEELQAMVKSKGEGLCLRALYTAVDEKNTKWSYIKGIFKRYAEQGITTVEELDRFEAERSRQRRQEAEKKSGAAAGGQESFQAMAERIKREMSQ